MVGLLIIGVFLILVSTYNFALKIPTLDSDIDTKKLELDFNILSGRKFENLLGIDLLAQQHLILLSELQPNSSKIGKINGQIQTLRLQEIVHMHTFIRGKTPSQEFRKVWII